MKKYLKVNIDNHVFQFFLDDVIYISKLGDTVKVGFTNKQFFQGDTQHTLKQLLDQLPDNFIQCHSQYIINLQHVKNYCSEFVYLKTKTISITKNWRQQFINERQKFESKECSKETVR